MSAHKIFALPVQDKEDEKEDEDEEPNYSLVNDTVIFE